MSKLIMLDNDVLRGVRVGVMVSYGGRCTQLISAATRDGHHDTMVHGGGRKSKKEPC